MLRLIQLACHSVECFQRLPQTVTLLLQLTCQCLNITVTGHNYNAGTDSVGMSQCLVFSVTDTDCNVVASVDLSVFKYYSDWSQL